MTTSNGPLLEATREALYAASIGDLKALEVALAKRRAALQGAPASERAAAFQEGESLAGLLRGIKRRIGDEHRRLELIKTGLGRMEAPRLRKVDLRA